ncbi:DUF305 domain-containing protein [Nocardioides sp.]|uniref:DUF305 domain-containing protein n=1 Tax=Nocardioides sp. TaxID=35761 RepID=UPI003565EE69
MLTLTLTGCSSGPGPEPEAADASGPRVIQPGKPGEAAAEVAPDEASVPDSEWNHTDVAFMQMMIPHHAQAIDMAELVPERAGSDVVRRLAERIKAAQGPEILTMAAWLADRGLEVPKVGDDMSDFDHGKHGHHSMTGMLSEAQLERLASARGTEFDRLFLTGMIQHHRGAISMANDASPEVGDVLVSELVADVNASQSAEINRMRDLLAAL